MISTRFDVIPFVGRKNAIRMIKTNLTSSWETTTFNIVGAYGSGKTAFLGYIRQQIENGNWSLITQEMGAPQVLIISGKSFGETKENFAEFLYKNVKHQLKLSEFIENSSEENVYGYLRDELLNISLNEHPLVIMIDDFTRIMKKIDVEEIGSLSSLLVPGVHYIFVTDHRDLAEIDPGKYNASPFFYTSVTINLLPLANGDAGQLIAKVNENEAMVFSQDLGGNIEHYLLDNRDIELIKKLGGGHAGLLISLTQLLHFEKFNGLANGRQVVEFDEYNMRRLLRNKILQDGSIYEFVNNISMTAFDLKPDVQRGLLSLAIQDREENMDVNVNKILAPYQVKLITMNLIGEDLERKRLYIPGELIRFMILQNITDQSFSGVEDRLFELLRLHRPELVSFELIGESLSEYMEDMDEDSQKRFIDSTISRLRKKIAKSVNPAAFQIENVRSEGFSLVNLITLDVFFEHGSSVFTYSETELSELY